MPSWAGGWDNQFGQAYSMLQEPNATARGVARLMSPQGAKLYGALGAALTGAVVGGPVNAGYTQVQPVQADGMNQGGNRPILAYSVINRNTTIADEILLDLQLLPRFMPAMLSAGVETSGYPVDKSGNGGGGKAGTIN